MQAVIGYDLAADNRLVGMVMTQGHPRAVVNLGMGIQQLTTGAPDVPGTFFNLHCRAALPLSGPHSAGRTGLRWIIDGERGTREVQNRAEDGTFGVFLNTSEKRVLLNGEEVKWEATEADRLGPSGKAWLEFAKGKDGVYYDLEKSLKIHRVLDAALASIRDGKRVSLD